jgi:hypothetical protein
MLLPDDSVSLGEKFMIPSTAISTSRHGAGYAGQQTAQKSAQVEERGKAQESERLGAGALAGQSRYQTGLQILQASFSVSISAGDQPQALLFRSSVDHINQLLEPELGVNTLPNSAISQDYSPEATAGRILSFSTGFYETYAKQHPGEDPEKLATDFVDVIRRGFEKGFDEAKNILEGLQAFNGDVAAGVMKTYELVTKGYDQFLADKLATLKPAEEASQATSV